MSLNIKHCFYKTEQIWQSFNKQIYKYILQILTKKWVKYRRNKIKVKDIINDSFIYNQQNVQQFTYF